MTKQLKWISYEIYVDSEVREQCLDFSPIQAVKTYAMGNADSNFMYSADLIEIVSSRRRHRFVNVEYYCDDDSLYSNGKRIA